MVAGTATTDCTDSASDVCKAATGTFPPFGPDMLGDNSDPYGGLGDGLEGDGNAGGGANYRKQKARRTILALLKTANQVRAEQQQRRKARSPRNVGTARS
jgi:hypothetical protein